MQRHHFRAASLTLNVLLAGAAVPWTAPVKAMGVEDPALPLQGGEPLWAGTEGLTEPRLIPRSKVTPKYPKKARRAGITARCVLTCVVTKEGDSRSVSALECRYTDRDGKIVKNSPVIFDQHGFAVAAVEAVKKWRYEPTTLDGEPVDVHRTIVVDFALE